MSDKRIITPDNAQTGDATLLDAQGQSLSDDAQTEPILYDQRGRFVDEEQRHTPRMVNERGRRLEAGTRSPSGEDILKGFVAGLVGGLVGTAVKSVAEIAFPPRPEDQDSPPVVMAERVMGQELDETQKQVAEQGIHWTFGTLTGGVYGALTEAVPKAGAGYGVPFAAVLFASAHEAALPALDLEEGPTEQPVGEQVNEFITHVAYGVTTDLVRRYVRKLL